MTPSEAFAENLPHVDPNATYGVAVSGGSDSTALLLLAIEWADRVGVKIAAATVDHGLRPEAADEAAEVGALCQSKGIPHETLKWDGHSDSGNLQSNARSGRYALLRQWAVLNGIPFVLLGHTQDDQAETLLMNLARGSGVDGLASIPNVVPGDVTFLRPLLRVRREVLRDFLQKQGVAWVDDPSNDDPRFDRVKARQMMAHLSELGLTAERLAQTAAHMRLARLSLTAHAVNFANDHVQADGPDLLLREDALMIGRSDTEGRVLSAAIQWIGGQVYRPRYKALVDTASGVLIGETRTLSGVVLQPEGQHVRLRREVAQTNAMHLNDAQADIIWDNRWVISGTIAQTELHVAALGEAISQIDGWREIGLPRLSLMATPAIFQGETLISAPVAGLQNGWKAQIVADFPSFLASH